MPTKPEVHDKQLAVIVPEEAKRRWDSGLPCTLKQMAVALEVGYSVVRHWSKMPEFPMLKGFVFPKKFDLWLSASFRSAKQEKAEEPHEHHSHSVVGKSGGLLSMHGSQASLPRKAARVCALAGL